MKRKLTLSEEYVLWLDVEMNNISFVDEVKRRRQVTRQSFRLVFGKCFSLANTIFEDVPVYCTKECFLSCGPQFVVLKNLA